MCSTKISNTPEFCQLWTRSRPATHCQFRIKKMKTMMTTISRERSNGWRNKWAGSRCRWDMIMSAMTISTLRRSANLSMASRLTTHRIKNEDCILGSRWSKIIHKISWNSSAITDPLSTSCSFSNMTTLATSLWERQFWRCKTWMCLGAQISAL